MPYVIDVGIEGDRPGKDDGVEVPFIDKFLNEGGPFRRADMHRDTQRLELALDDDRRLVFDKERCTVCTLCTRVCPVQALQVDSEG